MATSIKTLLLGLFVLKLGGLLSQYSSNSNCFTTQLYTTQDGLSSNMVHCIKQDSRGYLWLGNTSGLTRFDGKQFSNYQISPSIQNSSINAVAEYQGTKIFLGSRGGLYQLDGETISAVPVEDSAKIEYVYQLKTMSNGELWAFTKAGVYKFEQNAYRKIKLSPNLGNDDCYNIIETQEGQYYNLEHDIIFFDKKGKFKRIVNFPFAFVVITGYWNGQLYFRTNSAIYKYDGTKVKQIFTKQLSRERIFSCFRDSKNRFWVSTKERILISEPNNEEHLNCKIDFLNKSIPHDFFEDGEENIWVTTSEGPLKIREQRYISFDQKRYPFLTDLNHIKQDKENSIFLFSEANGLIRWKDGIFSFSKNNPFKGELIDAICFDEKNNLWTVTRNKRLLLYNNGLFSDFTKMISVPYQRELRLDLAYDEYRKKVWVTADSLMFGDENKLSVFKSANGQSIPDPQLILPLNRGKIIVSNLTNNLMLIDSNNVIHQLNIHGILLAQRSHKMFSDFRGNVWVSYSGTGLLLCRLSNDSTLVVISKITGENGLRNNDIESIAFDKNNRIWVATLGGVTIIDLNFDKDPNTPMIYHLDKHFNMPVNGLLYGALISDVDSVWYMSQYSLMKFCIDKIDFIDIPPSTAIDRVDLNLIKTDWTKYTDSLSSIFQIPHNPLLNYSENTITISFKAVSMNNNSDYQYSYMLKGLQKNWSTNSSSNSITFTKLNPGSYTFLVKARKTNSEWSEPASFTFTILPALWQHWWFNPLLIIVFCGVIYWLYRFRIKQIKREEKVRRRLASDLHDDIGSTLSSISYYSEAIRKQVEDSKPEVITLLDKMEAASDNTVDAMSDIVWATNPSFDKGVNLFNRMRSYAAEICALKNINLEFEADPNFENTKLNMDTRRNIFLVFKEAVNNAVKYSGCSLLRVHIGQGMMQVTDNGRGFDTQKEFVGNGLKNMQQRAKEIKGTLELSSPTGKGTSVILKF